MIRMKKQIRVEYDAHLDDMNKNRFDHMSREETTFKEYHNAIYDIGMKAFEKAWKLKGQKQIKKRAELWFQVKLILIMLTLVIGMSALIVGCWGAAYLAMLISVLSLGSTLILKGWFK